MSGFEVAGLVLGAFPLAISALSQYREAAKRIGFWRHIQVEYLKCSQELGIQYAIFKGNLSKLLMPLVVTDDKIEELLADPVGESWRQPRVEQALADRLKDSHSLYLECIEGYLSVMEEVNHELALYSESVQEALKNPKPHIGLTRFRKAIGKEGREFKLYKLKFSNGEATRSQLFSQLQKYNDQLEKLLSISDENAQLLQKRSLAASSRVKNAVLCSFWLKAERFFSALASAWNCCCSTEHRYAWLLLQHRPTIKPEFNVVFAKPLQSSWEIRKTRIAEEDGPPSTTGLTRIQNTISVQVSTTIVTDSSRVGGGAISREPSHRQEQVIKSALRSRKHTTHTIEKPLPLIAVKTVDETCLVTTDDKPIVSLCVSLDQDDELCCGYMSNPDGDRRFYVYRVSKLGTSAFTSITLDQLLRDRMQSFSRTQRNYLALILASSFLQLLDTPWLPDTWKKSDIVFIRDATNPLILALDQPHLRRGIVTGSSTSAENNNKDGVAWATTNPGPGARPPSSDTISFLRSLDLLGIILLELCFGQLLEDQPWRKRLPEGNSETERVVFDIMAARDWQVHVNGEAGPDYASAVSWCFGDSRNTPPDTLRQEMFRNVIQPLERCHFFLGCGYIRSC